MNNAFQIDYRRSAGNLHIVLSGEFNGMCAWELYKTIRRQYAGSGRIFVNTNGLKTIIPDGRDLFKRHMGSNTQTAPDQLYFKGKKGFQIAPDGSRVLICSKPEKSRKPALKRSCKSLRAVRTLKKTNPVT